MAIIEMKVPVIGESVTEVTLSKWLKADGAYVNLDDPICEFESDKATLEFPAEAAGKLIHVAAEGSDLQIGMLVAKIDTAAAKESPAPKAAAAAAPEATEQPAAKSAETAPASSGGSYAEGHPSPAAAKILKENAVAPSEVAGTGRDGRITKEDAAKAVEAKQTPAAPPPAKPATPAPKPAPVGNFSRTEERKKMSRMRRTIAKRLVSAKK